MEVLNVGNPDDVMEWADGFWCYRSELEEITGRSDDYKVIFEGTQAYDEFMAREDN